MSKINEAVIMQMADDKPYWYLTMVAVTEILWGKGGIAKQLIKDIMERRFDQQTFERGVFFNPIILTT